jgi:hypothetical protein
MFSSKGGCQKLRTARTWLAIRRGDKKEPFVGGTSYHVQLNWLWAALSWILQADTGIKFVFGLNAVWGRENHDLKNPLGVENIGALLAYSAVHNISVSVTTAIFLRQAFRKARLHL